MKDLRATIAQNIALLRTEAEMTQIQLAELLNYSDKAVSKWERAEALPDVTVLWQIARHFGVSVDYLLCEHNETDAARSARISRLRRRNRFIVSLMSVMLVWLVSALVFSVLVICRVSHPWLTYIWAIPVSSIVLLVFNSIWGRRKLNFLIVSLLTWSLLASIYVTALLAAGASLWVLFIIGVPFQIILLFVPGITIIKSTDKGEV